MLSVIPAKAGMIVRTAPTGTPPTVIPAKASLSSYKQLIRRRNHWIVGSPFVPSYVPFCGGRWRTFTHSSARCAAIPPPDARCRPAPGSRAFERLCPGSSEWMKPVMDRDRLVHTVGFACGSTPRPDMHTWHAIRSTSRPPELPTASPQTYWGTAGAYRRRSGVGWLISDEQRISLGSMPGTGSVPHTKQSPVNPVRFTIGSATCCLGTRRTTARGWRDTGGR